MIVLSLLTAIATFAIFFSLYLFTGKDLHMNASPDVTVINDGSIWAFVIHTPAAAAWVDEHVSEIPDYMGAWNADGTIRRFSAESRYAHDIASGMTRDGLSVED